MERTDRVDAEVERRRGELSELARTLHAMPELAFEEHRSAETLAGVVEAHGTPVERGLGGLATAFRARNATGPGPVVALLAEYDALPEIGHACGHNLIAAAAVGAFWALDAVRSSWQGTVDLVGTPAEEGGGGKIALRDAGVFEGVDAAMMFHPFDRDLVMHPTLANCRLRLTFSGVPSHAAIAPWDGSSALTACLDTFRLIDGQRVHFRDGVRVHGFIQEGGSAVNIIPERAVAELSVRALDSAELDRVRRIVERCAQGAAMASGVEVATDQLQGYQEMRNNEPLARRFAGHLAALGRTARDTDPRAGSGSTDAGNLSHDLPLIHPWLAICAEDQAACHQHEFAALATSEGGLETMILAAKCLARTALDVLSDPTLRADMMVAFDAAQP